MIFINKISLVSPNQTIYEYKGAVTNSAIPAALFRNVIKINNILVYLHPCLLFKKIQQKHN